VSDVSGLDAEGLPEKLGNTDLLMHRGEANPRLRSGIMSLEILDDTPGWARYLNRFEDASRRPVRLRQKVVMPTLSTTAPRCVVDPDFNLLFHVRRVHVPQPGTLQEVLDLAEVMLQSPLEVSRPLWSATLIEGLAAPPVCGTSATQSPPASAVSRRSLRLDSVSMPATATIGPRRHPSGRRIPIFRLKAR
jgi:diacylglycerol O-acyltransferase / wax synthase